MIHLNFELSIDSKFPYVIWKYKYEIKDHIQHCKFVPPKMSEAEQRINTLTTTNFNLKHLNPEKIKKKFCWGTHMTFSYSAIQKDKFWVSALRPH